MTVVDSEEVVSIQRFNILMMSLGYEFARERNGFHIWRRIGARPAGKDGSWPDQLVRPNPEETLSGTTGYPRNVVADVVMQITGEGPFEAVHRVEALLVTKQKRTK